MILSSLKQWFALGPVVLQEVSDEEIGEVRRGPQQRA